MSKRRMRVAVAAAVLTAVSAIAVPASAGPIDDAIWDAQNCSPDPNVPTVSDGWITGTGGVSGCKIHFGFTICLDYNGTIQPLSCNDYGPDDSSGSTNPIRCHPGLWVTTVQIKGVHTDYLERHSGFVLYIDECPIRIE